MAAMRLIDADEILKILKEHAKSFIPNYEEDNYEAGVLEGLALAECEVNETPTIEERKHGHGHWIVTTNYDENGRYAGRHINCSKCEFYWREATHASVFDYCPHCGAIMDEIVER